MAFIDWSSALSTGVTEFDNQHSKLVALANELHDAMRAGKAKDVLGTILGNLISYTATHFAAEERLMVQHNYPDKAAHQIEHRALVDKVNALKRDFDSGKVMLSMEVMNFLKDWLGKHIQGSDKKYGPYFNSKGVK